MKIEKSNLQNIWNQSLNKPSSQKAKTPSGRDVQQTQGAHPRNTPTTSPLASNYNKGLETRQTTITESTTIYVSS